MKIKFTPLVKISIQLSGYLREREVVGSTSNIKAWLQFQFFSPAEEKTVL